MDWHTLAKTGIDTKGYIEKSWRYGHCTGEALNLAAEHGHFEVVKWLYDIRTDTCSGGCSAMSKAVENGHLSIAQWFHSVKREVCSADAIIKAAKNGHLEVLEWLHLNNLFKCTKAAIEGAAESGHLEVVKWLHQVQHERGSAQILRGAVNSGNLELVEWVYENVHLKCHRNDHPYLDTTTVARRGHLDLLKWLHEHFPDSISGCDDLLDAAAANGHMDVIEWLHKQGQTGYSESAPCSAARNGDLPLLKWLHAKSSRGIVNRPFVMDWAASKGYLEIVRWLHGVYPEGYTNDSMNFAATAGHLDIFLFLLEHRTDGFSDYELRKAQDIVVKCHFGPDVLENRCSNRATSDQLKVLQTVYEQRPDFVRDCLRCLARIACEEGNLAILDWVGRFGLELRSTESICVAIRNHHAEVLQWFLKNGLGVTDPELLEFALQSRCLEAADCLLEHGYDLSSVKLIDNCWNVPTLRWMVEHGSPLDLEAAHEIVFRNRHIEIAGWVAEEDRGRLVLEALYKDDREVLWWILVRTTFQGDSVQRKIRNFITYSPKEIQLWIDENLRDVDACSWCFFGIDQATEGGEEEYKLLHCFEASS